MWDFAGGVAGAAASYFGGEKNRETQLQIARENIAAQREFAQQGVRWKVSDAMAAGIHPLAALGASTIGFSPVSVGDVGGGLAAAGQDIGRAVRAMQSLGEKEKDDVESLKKLALDKAGLENDLLRTQIRRLNAPGTGPGMPTVGKKADSIVGKTVTAGAPVKEDDIKQKKEDYPATQIGRPYGFPVRHNVHFGDAQSFEDRYGDSELAQTLKFIVNTGADAHNVIKDSGFPDWLMKVLRHRYYNIDPYLPKWMRD